MPVYNVEKYIIECMDSIVSQETRWSFLVTVVNDGSPDRSRELLRKYESLPNVQIIDQENRGHAGARNAALRHIRGEYVMFVDSDDSLRPGAVEALMNTAKEHNCDIVQGGFRRFRGKTTRYITRFDDEEHNGFLNQETAWAKVYRTELWTDIGFLEGYWFEDKIIQFITYTRARSIRTISAVVYNYRSAFTNTMFSSIGSPKTLDALYTLTRILKDCQELGLISSDNVYNHFLLQVNFCFLQALSLPSRNVWCEMFWQLVALKEEYFPLHHTELELFKPIEAALVAHDRKAYNRAVISYYI